MLPLPTLAQSYIDGWINFHGNLTTNTGNLEEANVLFLYEDTRAAAATGDFAAFIAAHPIVGDLGKIETLTLEPVSGPFLSIQNYSFTLDSVHVTLQNSTLLYFVGTGIISGNGFSDTPGVLSFSTQTAGYPGDYTWSAELMSANYACVYTMMKNNS